MAIKLSSSSKRPSEIEVKICNPNNEGEQSMDLVGFLARKFELF